jgi:hypothetical protein
LTIVSTRTVPARGAGGVDGAYTIKAPVETLMSEKSGYMMPYKFSDTVAAAAGFGLGQIVIPLTAAQTSINDITVVCDVDVMFQLYVYMWHVATGTFQPLMTKFGRQGFTLKLLKGWVYTKAIVLQIYNYDAVSNLNATIYVNGVELSGDYYLQGTVGVG